MAKKKLAHYFTRKVIVILVVALGLLGGLYFYFGGFVRTNLTEELGYVRAVDGKVGQYSVTFDSADWLFTDSGNDAPEQTTKTINHFSISPHIYFWLKSNPHYFNVPTSLYLNSAKEAVKIELIDENTK